MPQLPLTRSSELSIPTHSLFRVQICFKQNTCGFLLKSSLFFSFVKSLKTEGGSSNLLEICGSVLFSPSQRKSVGNSEFTIGQ